ncbi:MAG: hypothetical protein H7122_19800 [Chitinophagaceae bacterium]|nr:hypothetical protein [Chitinophagaceae bacterium]
MKRTLASIIFLLFLSSCGFRQAYYFSPFNGNTPNYHTTPLQIDSIKNATYGSILLGGGEANDRLTDNVFIYRSSVYRSHAREKYQFYYGGNITLGNYQVRKYDTLDIVNSLRNGKIINENAGNKFWGGLGLNAGVNYTIPFRTRHELRIGTESSYHYEFGNYLEFRKKIPDSAVTLIHRQGHFITLGLYTELAFKIRNGSIGFKIAIGTPLGKNYSNADGVRSEKGILPFGYFSPTFQYTNKRWTGFVQLTGAAKAFYSQIGGSYRLASATKKQK